jgi:hypothetical protein
MAWNDMSMTSERIPIPATLIPGRRPVDKPDSDLNVSVVFTGTRWTSAAIKSAGTLADSLGCSITLLVPQIVPYPLPLERPPVPLGWNEKRFEMMAGESPVGISVKVYLCRDRAMALGAVLKPHSIVFIGGLKRWWWPTTEERLAKTLRRAGHEVIFLGTE